MDETQTTVGGAVRLADRIAFQSVIEGVRSASAEEMHQDKVAVFRISDAPWTVFLLRFAGKRTSKLSPLLDRVAVTTPSSSISRPISPIETAVLDGFSDVFRLEVGGVF